MVRNDAANDSVALGAGIDGLLDGGFSRARSITPARATPMKGVQTQ
jgi:hypothetical protein